MFKSKKKKQAAVLRALKSRLITANNPKSPISEQYRTIRTNIQFSYSSLGKELKILAFTSARPCDGKSTTITNLAITFAQQDQNVLLIDADFRKPMIHQLLSVSNQYGLTSLIAQKATKRQAIMHAPEITNLFVLPSGPIPSNPSELLSSKIMGDLILDFKDSEKYDWILFDTPPVLAVTDAQILGSRCDGVILVIKSHQTERKELVKAKNLLDKANINVIGSVINGINQKELDYSYYYR